MKYKDDLPSSGASWSDSDLSDELQADQLTPIAPGVRVGSYVLDELMAQGGFGVVYRAHHAEQGTPAAVKILHRHLAPRVEVVQRFEREIEVIHRIQHPNVVRVFEHGRYADGSPFLAMELLEGLTLAEHLTARGRMGRQETLSVLMPLASALDAAHALGVIHRDIKGSNVFLEEEPGGGTRVVLLDFGIAKLLDDGAPDLTGSREIVGSLSCLSPEQILRRPVDARTDVYGLAILAYRMLVGELPFRSNLFVVMQELHLRADPAPPSGKAPLNPAVDDVILKGMSKVPEHRYPTVRAFAEAFRAAVEGAAPAVIDRSTKRRAIAVYAETFASEPAFEIDDELEAGDAALPSLAAALRAVGLTMVVETGTSMLLSVSLPEEPSAIEEVCRRTLDAAMATVRHNQGAALRLCVHIGDVVTTPAGSPVSGDLLDIAGWVPDDVDAGVFASPEVLAYLGAPPSAGVSGARLRVDPSTSSFREPATLRFGTK